MSVSETVQKIDDITRKLEDIVTEQTAAAESYKVRAELEHDPKTRYNYIQMASAASQLAARAKEILGRK